MPKTNLPFGKIVATPTLTGWSQAYGAGGFFVTLALSQGEEKKEQLGAIGKKLMNDLEAEFFALPEKTLSAIKTVLETTFSQVEKTVTVSAALAYMRENTLYVFLYGAGTILLRRDGTLGTLITEADVISQNLQAASGTLLPGDLVLLTTKEFGDIVSPDILSDALSNTPEDIAEILSPTVHKAEKGAASAIFFTFQGETEKEQEEEVFVEKMPEETEKEEPTHPTPILQTPTINQYTPEPTGRFSNLLAHLPTLPNFTTLSHRQRVLVSVAIVLVAILLASIFFTRKNAADQNAREVFAKAYEPAKRHFDEGEGLLTLNMILAREELTLAQKLVEEAEGKIPTNSKEGKELALLKEQIEAALEQASGATKTSAKPVSDDASLLMAIRKGKADRLFVAQNDENIYALSKTAVLAFAKNDKSEKTIITNDDDWANPAGLGAFGSNVYVLDKNEGILKYVPSGDSYSKSSYFTGSKPDLKMSTAMAIDSSIYVLLSSGDVLKFTKGAAESFTVSSLDMPLKNPTRIYTLPDYNGIYILDRGNNRVVKLDKNGAYQAQYQADLLSNATDFEVVESDKKIFFLAGGKIYEIGME